MRSPLPILCAAIVVGIGFTIWSQCYPEQDYPEQDDQKQDDQKQASIPAADGDNVAAATPNDLVENAISNDLSKQLRTARMRCSKSALDALVESINQSISANPAEKSLWHTLAESHLERALQRSHLLGMAPGKPTFTTLPSDFREDLELGLNAVGKARQHGDDSGELLRIEAGLMSQHITGFTTAIRWNSKITAALKAALDRVPDNPKLHTALGLRKLFAPTWLGNNPEKALEYFEFADKADNDERPAVFAAMASFLQKKTQQSINWLERSLEINPQNKFAQVVLKRLRHDEADPFSRDVTDEELAALH